MTNEAKLNRTLDAKKSRPKKTKIASLDKRKARAGWFFVLPFIIGFVLVYLPILFESIRSTVLVITYTRNGPVETFVGWENYREALFVDPDFVQTLVSGLKQLCFDIPAILIF